MALGFIKKVFSFGKRDVEERPAEDAPLPPLNLDALEALKPAADQAVPEFLKREEPAPADIVPVPEQPEPVEEPAPEPTPAVEPEILPDPLPVEDPQQPEPEPEKPDEQPVPAPQEIPVVPAPVPVPVPPETPAAPSAPAPSPEIPAEPTPPVPEQLPVNPVAEPAPAPVEMVVPEPVEPEVAAEPVSPKPQPGKVTVARKVEQKAEPKPAEPEQRRSWFQRMRDGLARSSKELSGNIAGVFTRKKLDEETLQDLEDVLIRADLGMETALRVTDALSASRYGKEVSDADVRAIMATEIEKVLTGVALPLELDLSHKPHVVLVVGVNGTGKTTTIGKLAAKLTEGGLSVMLAAGDTFRAAAIEQLKIWGERTNSPVVSSKLGADAAGLAYDAFEQAKQAGTDVLIIDTAGRLHNKTELMAELEKIVRVLGKLDPDAPHTVLQTVDATTGQNALNQVEIFRNIAGVNGLVMTKLDGTARGGILVAIAAKHKLPVYFIGVGEQVEDLEPFSASEFARAIAGVA